jgi:Putative peptidoglycan binding domain
MRYILGLIVAMSMLVAAATGETTPPAKKKTASTAKKSAVRRPSAAAHPGAAAVRRPAASTLANRKKAAPAKNAVTWRNRQLAPSQDRYREIQQALASKGYLQTEQATGTWDQNSTGALKRFQAEQNLDASGKINSLSLIALGLGPKHDALPTQIAAPEEPRQ